MAASELASIFSEIRNYLWVTSNSVTEMTPNTIKCLSIVDDFIYSETKSSLSFIHTLEITTFLAVCYGVADSLFSTLSREFKFAVSVS